MIRRRALIAFTLAVWIAAGLVMRQDLGPAQAQLTNPGTLTSLATATPITGGPITTSGTIACATCVTSAASLTSGQAVFGAGSQGAADLATAIVAPGTPASGKAVVYVDSTSKNLSVKDDAGVVKHAVQTNAGAASNFLTAISDAGVVSRAQPTDADLSTSDITTNNASTSKHGFAPKYPNDATKFLDGTGAYTVPAGAGATITTFTSVPPADANGGSTSAIASQTVRNVTYLTLPGQITLNQLAVQFSTVGTAGNFKLCLYNGNNGTSGAKVVDITVTPSAAVVTGAVASVVLPAGGYYFAYGCGSSACSVTMQGTPAAVTTTLFGSTATGKQATQGTVTHTSGTCNATIGSITQTAVAQAILRGDN